MWRGRGAARNRSPVPPEQAGGCVGAQGRVAVAVWWCEGMAGKHGVLW